MSLSLLKRPTPHNPRAGGPDPDMAGLTDIAHSCAARRDFRFTALVLSKRSRDRELSVARYYPRGSMHGAAQ